jgi:hypothetical protein
MRQHGHSEAARPANSAGRVQRARRGDLPRPEGSGREVQAHEVNAEAVVTEALEHYFRFADGYDLLEGCPTYFKVLAGAFLARLKENGVVFGCCTPRSDSVAP